MWLSVVLDKVFIIKRLKVSVIYLLLSCLKQQQLLIIKKGFLYRLTPLYSSSNWIPVITKVIGTQNIGKRITILRKYFSIISVIPFLNQQMLIFQSNFWKLKVHFWHVTKSKTSGLWPIHHTHNNIIFIFVKQTFVFNKCS